MIVNYSSEFQPFERNLVDRRSYCMFNEKPLRHLHLGNINKLIIVTFIWLIFSVKHGSKVVIADINGRYIYILYTCKYNFFEQLKELFAEYIENVYFKLCDVGLQTCTYFCLSTFDKQHYWNALSLHFNNNLESLITLIVSNLVCYILATK